MEITVQYTGQLANVVGASEETVELGESAELKLVVDQLVTRHGKAYADLVLDSDHNLRPSLLVIVDGEQAEGDRAALDLTGVKNRDADDSNRGRLTMETGLTDRDRAIYEWQLDVPGFGESGQAKLRRSTALISRCGGLGGPLAFSLAAAGFGKLILAHGGELRADDLNRQILMRHNGIGRPRVDSMQETLRAFNPGVEIKTVSANITESNAVQLVGQADIVFGAAPLFEERLLLNREAIRQGKPLVDCAMFNLEGHVIPILPRESACLACLYPEIPPNWKRRFPVIGAVSALAANVGAMEGIKLLTGIGTSNLNTMIYFDTASMRFQHIKLKRNPDCEICGTDS